MECKVGSHGGWHVPLRYLIVSSLQFAIEKFLISSSLTDIRFLNQRLWLFIAPLGNLVAQLLLSTPLVLSL